MRIVPIIAVAFLTFPLFAEPPHRTVATVAMLVASPETIATELPAAVADSDPAVRAIAARVANVRNAAPLLPALREALRNETNPETAREEVRAIGMIGGPAEIDGLLEASRRFDGRLDAVALTSIARADGAKAVSVYFDHLRSRSWTEAQLAAFFKAALWGRPAAVTMTASLAVAAKDEKAWRALLRQIAPPLTLDPSVAAVGMQSSSPSISTDAAWYLAFNLSAQKPANTSLFESALAAATATPAKEMTPARQLGYELVGRALGHPATERPELWQGLLAANELWRLRWGRSLDAHSGKIYCRDDTFIALLSPSEQAVVCRDGGPSADSESPRKTVPATATSVAVAPIPFPILVDLPKGAAAGVVESTGCRADWIGNVAATADHSGRLTSFDLRGVETSADCRRALEVLIPLTLAQNESIASPFSSPGLIVVKAKRAGVCADESGVASLNNQPQFGGETLRVGDAIKAPVVRARVEPDFSADARRALAGTQGSIVIIESRISDTGCVAPLRVLRASTLGELNASALLAITRWQFDPATLDGKPVSCLFNLTMNFKVR